MDTDEEENFSGEEYAYEVEDEIEFFDEDGDDEAADAVDMSSPSGSGKGKMGLLVPTDGYVMTEYSAITPMLDSLASEVAGLLDINIDTALVFLRICKWDKEKLMDQYFSNSERLFNDSGMLSYTADILEGIQSGLLPRRIHSTYASTSTSTSGSGSGSGRNNFCCRICFEDSSALESAVSLGCGHLFCRSCYAEYLRQQIIDGPSCILARCPEHKCAAAVPRTLVSSLVDSASLDRYTMFLTRNFIEMSRTMKYCPAAGCDKVAIGSGITTVRCSCSYPFCFKCGEEAHEPCSCAQLSEWLQKCHSESETANWILANTKKCPSCNARIEKNQGCNHMSCKLCKKEFCWICMGAWADHNQGTGGFYKCNRYDAAKSDGAETAAQKAKAELDRYLHYYQRYHGHGHALKFAANQRELAEKRMVERQEAHRSNWMDVQFLKQAAEQVIECRRVLKYTYVLGFFLKDDSPEKQLFEHHQEMLEKNTERLHEFTEADTDTLDRTAVVNLTRVTERFMTSLLSSISNGVVDVQSPLDSHGMPDYSPHSGSATATAAAAAAAAASETEGEQEEGDDESSTSGGATGIGGGGGGEGKSSRSARRIRFKVPKLVATATAASSSSSSQPEASPPSSASSGSSFSLSSLLRRSPRQSET